MITDHNIGWTRKRKLFNATDLHGILDNATTGVPEGGISAGVTQGEVGTTGIITYVMTDGEFLSGLIPLPYDLDPAHPLGFKVHWTANHDGTGTLTADWILLVDRKKEGIAIADAATALSTAIAQDTYNDDSGSASTTDWLYQVTDRGILLPATLDLVKDDIETGVALMTKLEMDAAVNETAIHFIALEMDYVPFRCVGGGAFSDRPLKADETA